MNVYEFVTLQKRKGIYLIFCAAMGAAGETFAENVCDGYGYETWGSAYITFYGPPNGLSIPKDASNGTVLYSETRYLSDASASSRCSFYTYIKPNNALSGQVGLSKSLFPILGTGLAWKINYQISLCDVWTAACRLTKNTDMPAFPGYYHGGINLHERFYFNKGPVVFSLIKIGDIDKGVPAGELGELRIYDKNGSADRLFGRITLAYSINPVLASCETPDVKVKMGNHYKVSSFQDAEETEAVNFSIRLNSCPYGINRVTYKLEPLTPVIDNANGVVALNAASTATGIGLKLRRDGGQPLSLGVEYEFVDFDKAGGNFEIPLSASYKRLDIAGGVTPGSANTEVAFVVSFL
ncbi:hypothetical protein D9M70_456450 [compost metagenome]